MRSAEQKTREDQLWISDSKKGGGEVRRERRSAFRTEFRVTQLTEEGFGELQIAN